MSVYEHPKQPEGTGRSLLGPLLPHPLLRQSLSDTDPLSVWEPEDRELMKNVRASASPEKIKSVISAYRVTANAYFERLAVQKGRGMARLGADLGKAFIKACQVGGNTVIEGKSAATYLADNLYRIAGEDYKNEVNAIIGGFLGEYAITQRLSQSYNVYLPDDNPDNYEEGKGVDLWVDLNNFEDDREEKLPTESVGLAIQVKTAAFKPGSLPRHIFIVQSYKDVDLVLDKVFAPQNMEHEYDRDKTANSLIKMVDHCETYSNVVGAMAVYHSPGQDLDANNPNIDRRNGKLFDRAGAQLEDDIEAIKDLYLEPVGTMH
jgi:hypothetical protein